MIKFFRRIRKALLAQNRFGKYLLYAIGEIVLVVIGILIALGINNLNESNQLEKKRQVYYQQLVQDLNKDKVFIKMTTEKFQKQRIAYKNYLKQFNKPYITIDEMKNSLLALNMESFALSFNTSTIESLQNSGEIVLIPPELRNQLIDYQRSQKKVQLDEIRDNDGKTGIAEVLLLMIGSLDLENRLENQVILKKELDLAQGYKEVVLATEAMQYWMNFSEEKSIRLLEELLKEIDLIESSIKEKMTNND